MSRRDILVFEREAIPRTWRPTAGAMALPWEEVSAWLDRVHDDWRWMRRTKAEGDARWKQPIPYVVVRDAAGRVAAYARRGSEGRLHGRWSIGIGGHVEAHDERASLADTVLACAAREMAEELRFGTGSLPEPRFIGVVNEELTDVGRVHWGLMFEVWCTGRPLPGPEVGELRWLLRREAESLHLEHWSRLALMLLGNADADGKLATQGRPDAGG